VTDQATQVLTELLKHVGEETVENHGRSASRFEMLARLTWDFVLNGAVQFPRGTVVQATPATWIAALKWLYTQLCGKPPARPALAGAASVAGVTGLLAGIAEETPPLNRHQRRAAAARQR
jgi:hypothetical protein